MHMVEVLPALRHQAGSVPLALVRELVLSTNEGTRFQTGLSPTGSRASRWRDGEALFYEQTA